MSKLLKYELSLGNIIIIKNCSVGSHYAKKVNKANFDFVSNFDLEITHMNCPLGLLVNIFSEKDAK